MLSIFQQVSRVLIYCKLGGYSEIALSHGRKCSIDTLELRGTLPIALAMPQLREQVYIETLREVVLWGPGTEQLRSFLMDTPTLEFLSYMVDDDAPVELTKSPSFREATLADSSSSRMPAAFTSSGILCCAT